MSSDLWGQLCTSGIFLAALESDIEVATTLAEKAAYADNARTEIASWNDDAALKSLLNLVAPQKS